MRDILSTLGSIFIGILLLGSVIYWVSDGFSTGRLSDVQSNLIMMQIKVQNLFSGSSSYSDLDNDLLLNNDIVPTTLTKGGVISNPWGGDITFAPEDNGSAFSITLTEVPPQGMRKHGDIPAGSLDQRHDQCLGNRIR